MDLKASPAPPKADRPETGTGEICSSLQRPDFLGTLPPELRCLIYRLLLVANFGFLRPRYNECSPRTEKSHHVFTAILRTKQLYYNEALPILYAENVFEIKFDASMPMSAWKSIGTSTASFGITNTLPLMRRLSIEVADAVEHDIFNCLELLHSIARSRIGCLVLKIFLRVDQFRRSDLLDDPDSKIGSIIRRWPGILLAEAIKPLHAAKEVVVVSSRSWLLNDVVQEEISRDFSEHKGDVKLQVDESIEYRNDWRRQLLDRLLFDFVGHTPDSHSDNEAEDCPSTHSEDEVEDDSAILGRPKRRRLSA